MEKEDAMTVRTVEEAEDAPKRAPMRRNAFFGLGGDCGGCCLHPACVTERKGMESPRIRHGKGHGKHRTLRDYRKGR